MRFPEHKETTLSYPEYMKLLRTEEGRRIIIENANEYAQHQMELKERSHRKERR